MAGRRMLEAVATGNFSGLNNAMQQSGNKAQALGQNLTSIGNSLTVGVTLPLVAAGSAAFLWASGTEEATNKVDVVFGDSADKITEFADTAAENLGISSLAAIDAAGTFGNLFRAMEIGEQPAADMSVQLIQLASDLASFNNVSPEQALEALRSGLVGEVEPLRAFGVNLSEARIKAEALTLGLWDGNGALDASAKAQAAFSLILQDTSLAQGDFARTADSAANQIRTFWAQVQDLGAELGTVLVPVVQDVVGVLQSLVGWFSDLSPVVQTTVVYMLGLAAAIGPLVSLIGRMVTFGSRVSQLFTQMGFSATSAGVALGALVVGIGVVFATIAQERAEGERAIEGFRATITGLGEEEGRLAAIQSLLSTGTYDLATASAIVAGAYGDELTPAQRDLIASSWDNITVVGELESALRLENTALAENTALLSGAKIEAGSAAGEFDALAASLMKGTGDLETRWTPAVASAASSTRDLAGAQGDLQGKVSAATGAIEAQQSTLRAMTDPAFAYIQASQQLSDAQGTLALAQADSTTSAADLEAAQMDVVAAYIGVRDAAVTLRNDPASASVFSNTIDSALGVRGQLQGVKTDLADINAALDKVSGRTVTFTVDGKVTSGAAAASFLAGRIGEYG